MSRPIFRGISGLEGSIPYGGIVRCGHKARPKGQPVTTDRFFILARDYEPLDPGSEMPTNKRHLRHPFHPQFRAFNYAAGDDEENPSGGKRLHGSLYYPTREKGSSVFLKAPKLKRGAGNSPPGGGVWEPPPKNIPACTGDGVKARRFNGLDPQGDLLWEEIDCPNDKCYFRLLRNEKVCGAFGELFFLLRWPGEPMEPMLVTFRTWGWKSAKNIKGLFDAIEDLARGWPLPDDAWNFSGVPFSMAVGYDTDPDKVVVDHKGRERRGTRFPVVTFELGDVASALRYKAEQTEKLIARGREVRLLTADIAAPLAAADDEELARAHLELTPGPDAIGITPGSDLPATVAVPPEAVEAAELSEEPEAPKAKSLSKLRLELQRLREAAGLSKRQVVLFARLQGIEEPAKQWSAELVAAMISSLGEAVGAAKKAQDDPMGPGDRVYEVANSFDLGHAVITEICQDVAGVDKPEDLPVIFLDAVVSRLASEGRQA